MKIIKSGEWKKRVVCRGCSAILECVVADFDHEQVPQEDESFAEQFFVTCPECSQKNVQKNVPPAIQEQIHQLFKKKF